jgi:hypothetical protein
MYILYINTNIFHYLHPLKSVRALDHGSLNATPRHGSVAQRVNRRRVRCSWQPKMGPQWAACWFIPIAAPNKVETIWLELEYPLVKNT